MNKNVSINVLVLKAVILPAILFWSGFWPVYGEPNSSYRIWLPLILYAPGSSTPVHQGLATYYEAAGAGACMFDPSPNDLLVAAMNAEEYDRNHRNPVARLEYRRTDGSWAAVPRTDYNYFVRTNPGMGPGP